MKIFILCFLVVVLSVSAIPAQVPRASYKVLPAVMQERPVNPLIYGNFLELGIGRQIEGLWAEKLYNASFEEVPPLKDNVYEWIAKSPNDDLSGEKWWHSGYETNDWYVVPVNAEVKYLTNRYWNFHHGLQAAVLENRQKSGSAWMAQNGIWINRGVKYLFRGYFSNGQTADPASNPVKVTVGIYPENQMDKPLVEKTILVPDGIYREFAVELDPGSFSGRSTFAASVEPGARAAMDGFSLMPVNAQKGWRTEVVEVLRQIHVPMIRFPGGCFASFYDWRKAVGPRSERQPVVSEYWGGIEENHAGTMEFVELCRLIGSEPFLCVNMLTGTADHAADWVEYCNGVEATAKGALRKMHGYPQPLGVRYWELDNETYRRFGWESYAKRCVEYAKAMKAVDPGIKLVMVGYWRFNGNLREMLEIAGKYIDVITNRSISETELLLDLDVIREYNRKNGTSITLSNTEWLAPLDWSETSLDALNFQKSSDKMTLQEHEITWNYAMNTARQLLLFQRLGGDLEFTSFNNLANTWGQNIIQCPKDTVFISAAGRIFELMSRSPLRWVLKTDTLLNLPGVYFQAGISSMDTAPFSAIPGSTSAATTASPTENSVIIYLLNYRSDSPEIRLDLKDFSINPDRVSVKTVSAAGPLESNTFMKTDVVMTSHEFIRIKNPKKPVFKVSPWSVTEIILNLHP